MTHKLDADDFFIHRVQRRCAEHGLNFFLIEPLWVDAFYEQLLKSRVWARVLLNMHSEHHQPEESYHRLIRLAFERKTEVIDPPDIALAAFDKASIHSRLTDAGFVLPFTVIVPAQGLRTYRLSAEAHSQLGMPFVIKPSLGYGKRGVILDARSEADLARSAAIWADQNYLLQRRIIPRTLDGRPAYFRAFYVFGAIWLCWWDCYTDRYSALAPGEEQTHGLQPLRTLVSRVADLTQMRFFSTEIAQTEAGDFVLIDYVNDQCHMLTQSSNPHMGVPDEVVAGIADRLVAASLKWLRVEGQVQ